VSAGRGRRVLAEIGHWFRPHSHDLTNQIDPGLEGSSEGIRATKIALGLLLVTSLVQLVIVLFSGSVALLADMIHNVADGLTSIPLWIAFVLSRRAHTRSYSYGYRRSEDLAGLFIVLVIAASAVIVAWESVSRLVDPEPLTHLPWVLLAGVVGVVGNELAARIRIRTGRRIGSPALVADGYHARTDTMASFGVIIAVAGAWAGYPIVDPIVGLLIAVLIAWIAVETARSVFRRLMDAVDEPVVARIEEMLPEVDGVVGADWVRARWTGHRMLAEVAICVDPELTVREGHAIAERVHDAILGELPQMESVTVHVNPAHADHGEAHAESHHPGEV
jgi:cation diffusion facilitator family transporter